MSRRIAVTGIGMVSAIGNDVPGHLDSLKQGRTGISQLENFPSRYAGKIPVGEIKINTLILSKELGLNNKGLTRTTLLAMKALREAVVYAALTPEIIASKETAIINANTVGGMCLTDEMYADSRPETPPSPYIPSYSFAATAVFFQEFYGCKGIINTINTACSSSANSIMYGARLMKAGLAKRAIVGGSDSMAKFTINGFNALRILSNEPCRPFDANRNGLNLGEGAAYLVLEWEDDAKGKPIYGYVAGYGNTNDSHHASALSSEGFGPSLAMQMALDSASIPAKEINYINAHGTATENNDLVESVAMKKVFGEVPPFNSSKCLTGHTLGAAGALEACISLLCLKEQHIFPATGFSQTIPETELFPEIKLTGIPLRYIMSNSFGFGGNCSSLLFSKS